VYVVSDFVASYGMEALAKPPKGLFNRLLGVKQSGWIAWIFTNCHFCKFGLAELACNIAVGFLALFLKT
jgi:hypothetical protein